MGIHLFRFLLFLPVILMAACIPYPHYEYEIPKFTGCIVDQDGKPIPDLTVRISRRGYEEYWRTRTNSDGQLYYPGQKEFSFFKYIGIGDEVILAHFSVYQRTELVFETERDLVWLKRMEPVEQEVVQLDCFVVDG